MSFDLDGFMAARQHDSDHALLLACLAEMESGTSGLSSLEIHAPLEVMARYSLLPLVDAPRRPSARRHIAKAAQDFANVAHPPVSEADEAPDFTDADWTDAPWPTVGRSLGEAIRRPRHLRALAERVLQQVGGAGHGQILLHHILDADPHVRRKLLPHMQMFVRAFGEDQSTAGGTVIPQVRPLLRASSGTIDEFLGGIPRSSLDTPHTGIRGVMARGQGVAVAEVGDSANSTPLEAAGSACVAAAARWMKRGAPHANDADGEDGHGVRVVALPDVVGVGLGIRRPRRRRRRGHRGVVLCGGVRRRIGFSGMVFARAGRFDFGHGDRGISAGVGFSVTGGRRGHLLGRIQGGCEGGVGRGDFASERPRRRPSCEVRTLLLQKRGKETGDGTCFSRGGNAAARTVASALTGWCGLGAFAIAEPTTGERCLRGSRVSIGTNARHGTCA